MKLNPLIAKTPEDLKNLEFKKMKGHIKKELKRLQKMTGSDKPTQFIIIGEFDYTDKKGMALPLFGAWKGKFKEYAKKEVVKDPCGAIGTAYFDKVDENGQKVIQIQLAKGKGKTKIGKIERTLKKLIPQAAYNVVFNEISEADLDALEQQLDGAAEQDENFEAPDMSDKGEIDVEGEGLDLKKLLTSNLKEITNTLADVKTNVIPKISQKTLTSADVDKVENLLDLCLEWQEIYDEASIFSWTKASFLLARGKVEIMQAQLEGLIPKLKVHIPDPVEQDEETTDVSDNSTTTDTTETADPTDASAHVENVVPADKTYNSAFQAADIAKEMYKEDHFQPGHAFIPFTGKSGKKYKKGDKIDAGDGNPTWCNQFAYELGDKVLGEANPFNMLPMGEGWTNANTLTEWMEKADGVMVDKLSGEGRFAKAWEQINKGKMVYFCHNNEGGIGHVATGAPTAQLRQSTKAGDMVGKVAQAGAKVGEIWIDDVWGKNSLGELGIYVGRFQESLPNDAKPDPNLHLAIYDKITHPIGQGKVLGNVSSLSSKYRKPSELQDVIASIRTVQQLLVNAGQSVGSKGVDGDAGGSTVQALKNIQAQLDIEQTGYVEYGDATWTFLWDNSKGKVEAAVASTTKQVGGEENQDGGEDGQALQPENIQFELKGAAGNLSAKADQVLREILAAAGEPKATIVNTLRSDEQQASVMLMNIKAYGAEFNKTQYKDKNAAKTVVEAYEAALAAGKSEQEQLGAILAAIRQVGAAKLSDHCNASNPAIDIHPSSILNKSKFEATIKADGRVTVICPPLDTTYHIVVK